MKGLPPLPPSDEDSLTKNKKDSFYEKKSGDFWNKAFIEHTTIGKKNKCEHDFEETVTGVRCKKCYMGLEGKELKVTKGHVFFGNQRLI